MIPIPIYRYKKIRLMISVGLPISYYFLTYLRMNRRVWNMSYTFMFIEILLYAKREVQEEHLWNQIDNYQGILNYHVLPHVRKISSLHKYCGSRGTVCILKFYNCIHNDICIGGLYGKSCNLYY